MHFIIMTCIDSNMKSYLNQFFSIVICLIGLDFVWIALVSSVKL